MERFVVLPILIPLFTAIIVLLLRTRMRAVRLAALAGSVLQLGAAIWLLARAAGGRVLVSQMDGWPAPYGITFAVDLFSAVMLLLAAFLGLVVLVYSLATVDAGRERIGYYALYQFLLMGVCGSFVTGDLFNLFVFFEVMLISSFGLMTLGGERAQLEGGLKYVVINMVSSILFLSALGILYGTTGTLNMAHLSQRLAQAPAGLTTVLASLFIIAFGIKAGVFPLFFWLPASYHTPPVAVSAVFAGLLTKVGVYALIRVFTLIFLRDVGYTHTLLLVVSGLTMVTGVLGAVAQYDFRRLLAFHIISQIGYMVMGLALFTPLALAGAMFHIVHNMVVKTNLFLVSGAVERLGGTFDLKKLGGLARTQPGIAGLFFISAMSLAGLPPLSGFFSKFMLVRAGLEQGQWIIVAVSLAVSLLTLFSMVKIWNEAFWKPGQISKDKSQISKMMVAPMIVMAAASVAMGLGAQSVFGVLMRAAEQMLNPAIYISAVLGP